jgi:hypothetical protein
MGSLGLLVDRQFKECEICGGKIQVDTSAEPGEGVDVEPKLTYIETHIGSCFPKPSEEVVADNSNVPAAAPAPASAKVRVPVPKTWRAPAPAPPAKA